jgi:uncharacterized small protein (DUF1192 family)
MTRMVGGMGVVGIGAGPLGWQGHEREDAMDTDDLDPVKKKPQKKDLTRMSVGDLHEYIGELKAEITRAEAEIAKKGKAKSGAENFFKS